MHMCLHSCNIYTRVMFCKGPPHQHWPIIKRESQAGSAATNAHKAIREQQGIKLQSLQRPQTQLTNVCKLYNPSAGVGQLPYALASLAE